MPAGAKASADRQMTIPRRRKPESTTARLSGRTRDDEELRAYTAPTGHDQPKPPGRREQLDSIGKVESHKCGGRDGRFVRGESSTEELISSGAKLDFTGKREKPRPKENNALASSPLDSAGLIQEKN